MNNNIISETVKAFSKSSVGRRLIIIIGIKLIIIFLVLKLFFFHNFLNSKFDKETEKSNYMLDQLTKK